eukprot:59342_1
MASQFKTIGLLLDGIAAFVSLLDLTTDIIVMITWYSQDRMTFFFISLSILILAQISYLSIFYLNHGKEPLSKREIAHTILSCLCTIPFAPFLSCIFYMVSDDASILRGVIDRFACYNFSWHHFTPDTNASPMRQYLDEKLYKHLGFLMEAIIEAFPQSILQLTAIVYYNEPNFVSIFSILISLISVCGKLLLLVSTDFRGYKMKLFVWLCFVIDFFGVFFIVSFAFYTPTHHPEYQSYFVFIRNMYLYELIICTLPFVAIGSCAMHLYWTIRSTISSPRFAVCAFMGITLMWIIGVSFTLILMQILCNWWFGLMIIWQATGERVPYNRVGKKFFSRQLHWVLDSKTKRQKIVKICVINHVLMDQHPHITTIDRMNANGKIAWDNIYNKEFHSFLEHEAKTQFSHVSFKQIRDNAINETHDYRDDNRDPDERDPRIWRAFYYEFYSGPLWEFQREPSGNLLFIVFGVGACWVLTYICLPIYLLSRAWHLVMPLFIVLYLYLYGGIILFVDVEIFQVMMWSMYVLLACIWCILLNAVCREEYVLWHILPNIDRFRGCDHREETTKMDTMIKERYFEMTLYPMVEQIVSDRFGVDIAHVILDYFNAMKIPFYWYLLLDCFKSEEVASIIVDFVNI